MKKAFRTGRLNDLNKQKRRSWLLFPGIMLVLFLFFGPNYLMNDSGGHYLQGLFRFIILSALLAVTMGIFPFYFIRARILGAKTEALRNASFITVQNIDYYREKLCELTPGEISLLEDLKLETDKDIAGCILRYELLGLICGNGSGGYERTGQGNPNANLRRSDAYLMECLVSGSGISQNKIDKWQAMVISEAKEEGLLEDKPFTNKTPEQIKRANICILVGWFLALCLSVLPVFPSILQDDCERYRSGDYAPSQTIETDEAILESLPDWAFFFSDLKEDLDDISEEAKWHHSATSYEKEDYLFQTNYYWELALLMLYEIFVLLVLLFPFLYMKMGMARMKERAAFRRTTWGNELTEYVWGMKNFIRDFSNLSEADKNALALWDDYLIYAVVLEENQIIINELRKRRNVL